METAKKQKSDVDQFGPHGYGSAVIIAYGIGILFGIGIALAMFVEGYFDFGFFLMSLSAYHLWEYLFNVLYHPEELSADSFLINHSREYHLALLLAVVEYFVEKWFVLDFKGNIVALAIGVPMVVIGLSLRMFAMVTAGTNFTHQVQDEKRPGHRLITYGIYAYLRHPAYFGWFWWSVGTQILLFNPLGVAVYVLAGQRFFKSRIEHEEQTLIGMFGSDYTNYRNRTPVGIPGIK